MTARTSIVALGLVAGMAAALIIGTSRPALAGGAMCELEAVATDGSETPDRDMATRAHPIASPDPRGPGRPSATVIVVGGPSESVVVIAPPGVNAIAIGGDGLPGLPGRPGQPAQP